MLWSCAVHAPAYATAMRASTRSKKSVNMSVMPFKTSVCRSTARVQNVTQGTSPAHSYANSGTRLIPKQVAYSASAQILPQCVCLAAAHASQLNC